jgi:adenylate cyclase
MEEVFILSRLQKICATFNSWCMSKDKLRRLAAIMFTDVVGYTSLMQKDEQAALTLLNHHRKTMEDLTASHGGKIIQYYGDGSLNIFHSAVEAVQCALEMQQIYRNEPKVPLRIGIHIGDIAYDTGDIYGDGVNVASRIETLGKTGAVLFSERVYDDIKNHPEFQSKPLGAFHFKNVEHPMQVYALTNEGLVVPTPEDMKKGKLKPVDPNRRKKMILRLAVPLAILLLVFSFFLSPSNWLSNQLGIELGSEQPRVLVKPFQFLNAGIDTILVKGMESELRISLANSNAVIPIGQQTSYAVAEMSLGKIRERSKADYVLETSVQRIDNQLILKSGITNLRTTEMGGLGADTIDQDRVIFLAPDLAIRIVEKVKAPLSEEQKLELKKLSTENAEALNLLRRSQHYYNLIQLDTAIQLASQAIALDSNYAEAYTHRGFLKMITTLWHGVDKPNELQVVTEATADMDKAISLNPNLPEAYFNRGMLKMFVDWDFEGAEADYKLGMKLNPPNRSIYSMGGYAYFLSLVKGDHKKAIKLQKKIHELDPENNMSLTEYAGYMLYWENTEKEGFEQMAKAIERMPKSPVPYWRAVFYFKNGDYEKAMDDAKNVTKYSDPRHAPWDVYMEGYIAAKEGDRQRAMEVIDSINHYQVNGISARFDYAFARGAIYAMLGDKEMAIQQLRLSFQQRESTFIAIKSLIPMFFYNIAEEPGFQALIDEAGMNFSKTKD